LNARAALSRGIAINFDRAQATHFPRKQLRNNFPKGDATARRIGRIATVIGGFP